MMQAFAAFAPKQPLAAMVGLGLFASAVPAFADGQLEARYALSLAGVEVGRAEVTVNATDAGYDILGTGRVTGILRAVSSGKGSVAARGGMAAGKSVPRLFVVSARADGKDELIKFAITDNMVKDLDVAPPPKPYPDRVEITDAHLLNVTDPLTGAFVSVPGKVDMLSAAACDRTVPVFDGRQRYDIVLSFERVEDVKIEKGFSGKAVVCQVRYVPVAGHRPTRSTVKYMQENKDMHVWLVPIAGTRLMAPFKVEVATLVGTVLFEATSFKTEAKEKTIPVNAAKP
ncbi:DUF3108 domain-containing protein [Aquabacter sp. L1I39]|uniref:DUF3108 domain-containing protein n=1 Tax=Aquabacter sp. L1I39 TaxID=2820278 RepID=UPI001AD9D97C|nr:DUF3108 domain-containing protein [Aquabacter sp. L1I39]QTL02806.1 DUF3108 domain-containing protein [Aquabacter sp. L1I39]